MTSYSINKERLADMFTQLCEIDSPSFEERSISDFMTELLKELGAESVIEDESAKETHSRIYKLEEYGFDPVVHYSEESELNEKLSQALLKSLEWGNKIPTGIF